MKLQTLVNVSFVAGLGLFALACSSQSGMGGSSGTTTKTAAAAPASTASTNSASSSTTAANSGAANATASTTSGATGGSAFSGTGATTALASTSTTAQPAHCSLPANVAKLVSGITDTQAEAATAVTSSTPGAWQNQANASAFADCAWSQAADAAKQSIYDLKYHDNATNLDYYAPAGAINALRYAGCLTGSASATTELGGAGTVTCEFPAGAY